MSLTLRALWAENRSILLFVLLMVVFRSSWADWNDVPTGSMEPSILVGDRILVDKAAYDLRVPLFGQRLLTFADPVRGDVVVYESAAADTRLVKRVIGFRATLSPCAETPRCAPDGAVFEESLPGAPAVRFSTPVSPSQLRPRHRARSHYLVLGDNRDNSGFTRVRLYRARRSSVAATVYASLDTTPAAPASSASARRSDHEGREAQAAGHLREADAAYFEARGLGTTPASSRSGRSRSARSSRATSRAGTSDFRSRGGAACSSPPASSRSCTSD